jgi:hypothetical protein
MEFREITDPICDVIEEQLSAGNVDGDGLLR